jgi:hypothetical protein
MGKLSTADRAKAARLLSIYLMTLEEHNAKRAEQKNACAICRRPFTQFKAFQDHDHACCPRRLKHFCGKCNRGLLCYLCNKYAVGLLEWLVKVDIDFERVVEYKKFWDATIKARGGYGPKPKSKKAAAKLRKEQTGV